MATAGSLINEFVSQNALILIAGVISTVIVIAASTYFIARNYMTSEESESDGDNPETQNETSAAAAAVSKQSTTKGDESSHAVADEGENAGGQSTIDPVYYCEHIQGEIKKVKQDVTTRKIFENLSPDQIEEEKKRQQDQLAEIFRLMQDQQEKFGISSMDEIQDQMRLYADFK